MCICTPIKRYDIDIDTFKDIELVSKRISMSGWNKEGYCTDKQYKQYKMEENSLYGNVLIRNYYKIIFNSNGEDYCLRIPPYEFDIIKKLLTI